MPDRKPHFSPSQLERASKCGESYRRYYIEGDRPPPAVVMLRGRGVHAGARLNYEQKIESRVDLPAREIVDAAVAAFDGDLDRDGCELRQDEQQRGLKVVLAEARDETASIAAALAKLQAPVYQPLMVEEAVRIELDGDRDLFGYVDLVAEPSDPIQHALTTKSGVFTVNSGHVPKFVVDTKTGKKKKTQLDVDKSIALTFYGAAAHIKFAGPADAVCLDTFVLRQSGKIDRDVVWSTRGEEDYDALMARVDSLSLMLEAGVFMPAPADAWWCSPTYCPYWTTCPYVKGGSR